MVTKCGLTPQRNGCFFVGSAKWDNNARPFLILSVAHQVKALQQFHFAVFCPKFPPDKSCIRILVFSTLTHTYVKRLASAVIYYTAVIAILSLTTLPVFSFFPSLSLSYCKSAAFGEGFIGFHCTCPGFGH